MISLILWISHIRLLILHYGYGLVEVFGSIYVCGNTFLIPIMGSGFTTILVLVGQISGSLLINQLGFFGNLKRRTTLSQILRIVVTIIGIIFVKM
ncbi:hypothetical protein FCS83_07365 [Oenococcus sp. UCMA 17063]|nr:hypothetical protein [Oenococcus sp. UCMA 17063]